MTEDDQIGEVRPRKEQRPRVGQEEASDQQWCLRFFAAARRVYEDRREKRDRRIEVERRRDERDQHCGTNEQCDAAPRRPCEAMPRRREEAVLLGDEPDEQETADQHERRPVLVGCRPSGGGAHGDRDYGGDSTKPSRAHAKAWGGDTPFRGAGGFVRRGRWYGSQHARAGYDTAA